MLFLFRSFFPDTAGDGTFRGGRAAGTAWTPHRVERLRNSLTAHGVEVPVSFGQFGGWPGICNRQVIARGTRVYELLSSGALPLAPDDALEPIDLERLGGEVEVLEAKVPEFELVPGDVVVYTWQGGGGYGDPLDRDQGSVERDLALGVISVERARTMYGVPGDRDALRRERIQRAEPPVHPLTLAPGEPVGRVGLSLVLARGTDGTQIECRCGHPLADPDGDWRRGCASRRLTPAELPRGIVLHASLELVQHVCPACGCQHGIVVVERGAEPLEDIRLTM